MSTLRGALLLAAPSLTDPSFERSVVLVSEHTPDGAMGIVLNRPSTVTVGEAVPQLEQAVAPEAAVFVGGPVASSSIVFLAEFLDPAFAALLVFGRIGFPSAHTDAATLAAVTGRCRVFAGYAGWGPGQLDAELERHDWIAERADPEDVFTLAPDALWRSALARKGGRFVLLSSMPPDPSLN